MTDLHIFKHQAERVDSVRLDPAQMTFDGCDVLVAKQAGEVGSTDRVMLTDRGEGRAILVDEIGRIFRDPNPRHGSGANLRTKKRIVDGGEVHGGGQLDALHGGCKPLISLSENVT